MADQHLLHGQRTVQSSPVAAGTKVDHAGRTGANMNPDRDIELLRQGPVRRHPRVVGRNTGILVGDFAEYGQLPRGVEAAQGIRGDRCMFDNAELESRNDPARGCSAPLRHPIGGSAQDADDVPPLEHLEGPRHQRLVGHR